MVYRKYRPLKQWGKVDTRVFKRVYREQLEERMPAFKVPEALRKLGLEIFDPNSPDFPTPRPEPNASIDHPAFRVPSVKDHPLYKETKCELFDGTEPFTDGIDQACALTKAVKRTTLPPSVLQNALRIAQPKNLEQRLCELIMQGERYDPTLAKLPKRFDPVLFWANHPVVYGTPVKKRSNIILDNLYRNIVLTAIQFDQLDFLRYDRDESLSCTLHLNSWERPLVIRSEPHLIVQSPVPLKPWADKDLVEATRTENVPDVTPIDPRIDLTFDHVYNDSVVVPRVGVPLTLDVIMWSREQDQKYPWTREQNAANAVMFCFGAAVSQAMRNKESLLGVLNRPILTRAVQLVNGMLDIVAFQLNTLDLSEKSGVKNIAWVEHAQRLYKPGPFYENYDAVVDLNVETYNKMLGLLLTR